MKISELNKLRGQKITLPCEEKDIYEKYQELIYAVQTKVNGETRHQTALRYIKEKELDYALCVPSVASEKARKMLKRRFTRTLTDGVKWY